MSGVEQAVMRAGLDTGLALYFTRCLIANLAAVAVLLPLQVRSFPRHRITMKGLAKWRGRGK